MGSSKAAWILTSRCKSQRILCWLAFMPRIL
jgi:hypothetical protein